MTGDALLLLDVDGPLNPFRSRTARLRGYRSHRMSPAVWSARQEPGSRALRRGLRVLLHPGHGARITALPLRPVWATTWTHQANEMISPRVGLPGDLPVIGWAELFRPDPDGLYWKTREIVAWAAGRPFAWVDDMITEHDASWVAAHHPGPALLLRISPRNGLRERDFTTLTRWHASLDPH
ncbi:HAD domain-containing protein [Streptomyces sp. BI20]|uniref:HAD domain-containing protein n=1 Tax=Streptomyces sp. BI20 TaxID=3403460 RepID=UPI003C714839